MASKFAFRYRKPVAAVGVGVRSTATQYDDAVPTITSAAGVPTAAEPNGSIFLRTNATGADAALYMRIAGSWEPIDGS
ncbi:hypothetical protein CMI37_02355 [Candidatus Pacearchaeota archaeon]|nr:hypothetical protein [Candidatus Pacearchaeota archaeon]